MNGVDTVLPPILRRLSAGVFGAMVSSDLLVEGTFTDGGRSDGEEEG